MPAMPFSVRHAKTDPFLHVGAVTSSSSSNALIAHRMGWSRSCASGCHGEWACSGHSRLPPKLPIPIALRDSEEHSAVWHHCRAVIIAFTIYNLSVNSTGLSHHGYYHWRTHIVYFIDKNWAHVMGPNV